MTDPVMKPLLNCVRTGFLECHNEDPSIKPFWKYRDALYELDGVILYDDRAVIPPSLRGSILSTLHAAHQGVSAMKSRASSIVFWPGITADIDNVRNSCTDCIKNAPSQAKLPPAPLTTPSTPFESIAADYFESSGHHYLVAADRLSGWPEIFKCVPGSPQSGSQGLMCCLRNFMSIFGVPSEISSDGGPEFTANATSDFFKRWGIHHRKSAAYNPQSNGRAEVAVKAAKRLLRSNTGPSGSINNDKFLRVMLQLRNTPDPDSHLSPAQVIFGRPLRDSLSFINRLEKFANPNIHPIWRDAWKEKEAALRVRYHRTSEALNEHSRPLDPLQIGDRCYIQNQAGNHPKRWDRSGTIVESPGFDSYTIKVDGSGRLTRRNRRYLRKFMPVSPTISNYKPSYGLPSLSPHHIASPQVKTTASSTSQSLVDKVSHTPATISDPSAEKEVPCTAVQENQLSTAVDALPAGSGTAAHENSSSIAAEASPAVMRESVDEPKDELRPVRSKHPRKFYDASTGKYV